MNFGEWIIFALLVFAIFVVPLAFVITIIVMTVGFVRSLGRPQTVPYRAGIHLPPDTSDDEGDWRHHYH